MSSNPKSHSELMAESGVPTHKITNKKKIRSCSVQLLPGVSDKHVCMGVTNLFLHRPLKLGQRKRQTALHSEGRNVKTAIRMEVEGTALHEVESGLY